MNTLESFFNTDITNIEACHLTLNTKYQNLEIVNYLAQCLKLTTYIAYDNAVNAMLAFSAYDSKAKPDAANVVFGTHHQLINALASARITQTWNWQVVVIQDMSISGAAVMAWHLSRLTQQQPFGRYYLLAINYQPLSVTKTVAITHFNHLAHEVWQACRQNPQTAVIVANHIEIDILWQELQTQNSYHDKNHGFKVLILTEEATFSDIENLAKSEQMWLLLTTINLERTVIREIFPNVSILDSVANRYQLVETAVSNLDNSEARIYDKLYPVATSNTEYWLQTPSAKANQKSLVFEVVKLAKVGIFALDVVPHPEIYQAYEKARCLRLIQDPVETEIYLWCQKMPLSTQNAILFYKLKYYRTRHLLVYLLVICTIEAYGYGLYRFPKKNTDTDIVTYVESYNKIYAYLVKKFAGFSDVDTIINIWTQILATCNPFYITFVQNFCRTNYLNFKQFKNIIDLTQRCLNVYHMLRNADDVQIAYRKTNLRKVGSKISKNLYTHIITTHHDLLVTINYDIMYGFVAETRDKIFYRVDENSVHKMNLLQSRPYLKLVDTAKINFRGRVDRVANVIHALADIDNQTDDII